MRRTYHRFPLRCDLDFDVEHPFIEVIKKIVSMNNTHVSKRIGEDLIRLDSHVSVADAKTRMVPVDQIPDLLETITEEIDFMITLNETILTGDRRIPRAETIYYLRVCYAGLSKSECYVSKDGNKGSTDAFDVKKLITGAFE